LHHPDKGGDSSRFEEIARAYQDSTTFGDENQLLRHANIVIFSDGQDNAAFNEEALLAARRLVPESVTININFICVGEITDTGKSFMDLARRSNMAAGDRMARALTKSEMARVAQAAARPVTDDTAFASSLQGGRAPARLLQRLMELGMFTDVKFEQAPAETELVELSAAMGRGKGGTTNQSVYIMIDELARRMSAQTAMPLYARRRVVRYVLQHYGAFTETGDLSALYTQEYRAMETLLRWAQML
jgi:hypothetical protein